MMKNFVILLAACLCLGCGSNRKAVPEQADTSNLVSGATPASGKAAATALPYQHKIIGTWTNGTTANATFIIGKDSIMYIDQSRSFKYELSADSIRIHYEDFNYAAKIHFIKDTLVMQSQDEGDTKYWKFKD